MSFCVTMICFTNALIKKHDIQIQVKIEPLVKRWKKEEEEEEEAVAGLVARRIGG